jgi:aspartyl-tRNA(Asn)/glutamyl-tRNA(Gln) amidotransferase subunit C
MSLSLKDLEHTLKLAHLNIKPEEKKKYLSQLQDVVGHMDQLQSLDLTGIEPSSYANDQGTTLREDVVVETTGLLLEKNAPRWENGCFRVPKIL